MAQVESPDNLARWPDPAGRVVTLILIRSGLRISSALALEFNCLLHDGQDAPYLRYFNTKMKREAAVPIDEELEADIVAQSGCCSAGQTAARTCSRVRSPTPPDNLTHQHLDLKELFQAKVRNAEGAPAAFARRLSGYEKLKADHARLLAHCAELEGRLQTYAAVINVLSLEKQAAANNAAVADIGSRRRKT